MFTPRGDRLELGDVSDPGDREKSRVGIGGIARNAGERFRVGELLHGGFADALERRPARRRRQFPMPAQGRERGDRAQRGPLVTRFGQGCRPRNRVLARRLVCFVAHDGGQHGAVDDTCQRRATNTRVGIVDREHPKRFLIGVVDLVETFKPHRRVGVLPLGLRAEFFEESHGRSPLPAVRPAEPSS